jgi:hypothetical protein
MTDTCLANLLATDMLESKYSLTEIRHKDVHAGIPLSKIQNPKLENSKLTNPLYTSPIYILIEACIGAAVVHNDTMQFDTESQEGAPKRSTAAPDLVSVATSTL